MLYTWGDGLEDDALDMAEIEKQISDLIPRVTVSHDFCAKCREFLDSWLEILRGFSAEKSKEQFHLRQFSDSLAEIEASKRNKCRLCTLFSRIILSTTYLYMIESAYRG